MHARRMMNNSRLSFALCIINLDTVTRVLSKKYTHKYKCVSFGVNFGGNGASLIYASTYTSLSLPYMIMSGSKACLVYSMLSNCM